MMAILKNLVLGRVAIGGHEKPNMTTSSTQTNLNRARYREGGTLLGRLRFFAGPGAVLFHDTQNASSIHSVSN